MAPPIEVIVVTLFYWEFVLAALVACMRLVDNLWTGAHEAHGADNDLGGFNLHFRGVLVELAVAKYLNLYWTGGWGNKRAVDVGDCVETRGTSKLDNRLLIYQSDHNDAPVVLGIVTNEMFRPFSPRVHLVGWLLAKHGKLAGDVTKGEENFWQENRERGGCYWVPQVRLHDMRELHLIAHTLPKIVQQR